MARPSHRLDVLVVPHDAPIERGEALLQSWRAAGVCTAEGTPGPAAASLGAGRFARVRLDRPDGTAFYANRQGGFRVACPVRSTPMVSAFSEAMTAWREGGPRALRCPACGEVHPLENLAFAPPAAFGPWALEIADVERRPSLGPDVEEALGPFRVVWRR